MFMKRMSAVLIASLVVATGLFPARPAAGQVSSPANGGPTGSPTGAPTASVTTGGKNASGEALIKQCIAQLNKDDSVDGADDTKSYKILFDAYLDFSKPPMPVGPDFNLNTIHPKMADWAKVSGWAESNPKMVQAIIKCKDKILIGMPYGRDGVDPKYVQAGLTCDIGLNGSLRDVRFDYIPALDTICAFATAETYRLMETGQAQQALDLGVATCFLLRQFCDREFRVEKLHAIEMLSDMLSNLRDVFYTYLDKVSDEQFTRISLFEIPFLRPDRGRLFMPEADRVVAEYVLSEVFDESTDAPDAQKFTDMFAGIQSKDAPMTRFGAAKRWYNLAAVHGSKTASLERLKLIYDDWWRRWRIDEYDSILSIPTEFERANRIRYAAVIYSLQDLQQLFVVRNQLIAEVNGTAVSAAICAYHRRYGVYPDQTEKTYGQFGRRRSDVDPYDKTLGFFRYRMIKERVPVDTPAGRLWIENDQALLYGLGQDHVDDRAARHTDDGAQGDVVLWPPIKAASRAAGLLQ